MSTIALLPKKPPIQEYMPPLKEPFRKINDITGAAPSERYGHSAVLDEGGGGVMIVFGGCDGGGKFCGDVFFYNIETRTWSSLDPREKQHGTPPDGRLFHTAVLHNGSMYVFGGNSNGYYNDLQRFHLETQRWTLIHQEGGDPPPSPRYGHSAVVFGDSMYIFGGYDKDGFACNDLHEYNFSESYPLIRS